MNQAIRDAQYAVRVLRRAPVFAAAAIFSLALGIGANGAIFQLIDTVSRRSLPVADPDGLIEVRAEGVNAFGVSAGFNAAVTHPLWEQLRAHQVAFASVFAWGNAQLLAGGGGGEARQIRGLWVSGDFFRVLGITPARGRLLTADDDRRGCGAGAVVLSHAYWQSQLGGRDAAIGSAITIQDRAFTILGVTPPRFTGLEVGQSFDVALPVCSAELWSDSLDRRDLWWLTVMGRLAPGWTMARADAYLRTLSPALLEATVPAGYSSDLIAQYRAFRFGAIPAGRGVSRLRAAYGPSLTLLFGLTALVLLITCANLATLTLARTSAREREIAVRVALGASRPRVLSFVLFESVFVATAGAVLAVPVAVVSSRALTVALGTTANPVMLSLTADWRLIGFVGASAALTAILFGLVPALRASFVAPIAAMRQSGRGMTVDRQRARFQRGLVVGQIAVSLVLIVAALLFAQSFRKLMAVDAGFEQNNTVAVWAFARQADVAPIAQRVAFQQRLVDEIGGLPGVASAAAATHIPLSGANWWHFFRLPGLTGDERHGSRFIYVSPRYFETLRIPLLAGRAFQSTDGATGARVMLVNESFARSHLQDRNPIGISLHTVAEAGYPATTYEIVGVVGNTKYSDLREEMPPIAYVPIAQNPDLQPWAPVFVRASTPWRQLTAAIVERVRTLDPALTVQFTELTSQVDDRLVIERTTAWLAAAFGALAIVMVTVGLYGIIAYLTVSQRNEIGVRLSLGSTRAQIVGLVLRDSLWPLAAGLLIGVPLAAAVMRGVSSLLFALSPTDLTTMLAATAVLAAAAVLAGSIPAWRAARVDPAIALRRD